MANEKIIAQDVFQQAVKDILIELVNSTYSWESYSDEEVGNLVELDPTQVAELSAVISDTQVAKNKVFSSFHTKELIQQSVIEANKYTDDLVANLSNIKLDIVDSLPDSSTVNKSTIYILKDSTGGTNNTLNVWSDTSSAFVEVGKLSVNMDNYYTKSEVDTLLSGKANADEVLKPDAIVADLTTTSGSTTLSTAGLQTELDKKANDDEVVKTADIATTIDSTSTNDTVAGAKAVSDKLSQYVHIDGENMLLRCTSSGTVFTDFIDKNCTSNFRAYHVVWNSLVSGIPCGDGYCTVYTYNDSLHKKAIAYDVSGNAVWEITQIVGVWGTWQQVRSGVTDVPITYINTFENETYVKPTRNDVCNYCVTNGFCIVTIEAVCLSTSDNFVQILSGLPKPKTTIYSNTIDRQMGSNSEAKATFQLTSDGRLRVACNYGESSISGTRNFYATFSYPVAES